MFDPDGGCEPRVRRALPEEAPLLTGIALRAKAHWGYPSRWLRGWEGELTVSRHDVRADRVYLLEVRDEVVGFHALVPREASWELIHLWVRPSWMGRGMGRRLFQHAVALACGAGPSTVGIVADPNAEGFYRRMGCRRIGSVPAPVEGVDRRLPRLEWRPSSD